MRLLLSAFVTALIVAIASPALAHSPSACPTPAPEADAPLDFVGTTTATVDGQGHLLGWLPLCRAEYPGSRVCTTRDLVESVQLPAMEVGDAWWVMPYWIDSQHEYSGRFNQESASCAVIQVLSDTPNPIFTAGGCNATRPVACCALVP
jgi:hypothetical protein